VPFTSARLKSIMCNSLAAGFESASFMNLLDALRDEFDLDIWQFTTFVKNTAAHIDKDGFMEIVRRWNKRVGTESMMKLLSVRGLAGRIINATVRLLWSCCGKPPWGRTGMPW
jgi:hypothetical protein